MQGKILVTGAGGQLGKELEMIVSSFPGFEFCFLTREQLSITDPEMVENYFHQERPDYCINCAAYTAVDKAESESSAAYEINAKGVEFLAKVCSNTGCRFIHISTDYVFNGLGTTPYLETDPVDPLGVYGASKRAGELLALESNPATIIIRTSWLYSSFGKNFVKTMIRVMKERESVSVVNDQLGSPTYCADLAEAIMLIISSGKWEPGIYHFCNKGQVTWYDFAVAIRDLTGSSCKLVPITSSEYPTPARRPSYSVFDTTKISNIYSVVSKDWKDSLSICIQRIQ
jgi:dTDP-4-dehydrorhamnose reductase